MMFLKLKRLTGLLPAALIGALSASAAVKLASPFGDHMVLQQEKPVPVWGTADAGEKVTVEFAGKKKTAVAGADGRWRVDLRPLPASAEPRVLTVKGSATIAPLVLTDVLVGEVWLCSGQSNMERQLGPRPPQKPLVNWEREVAAAHHPLIRELYVTQTTAIAPSPSVNARWRVCSPQTVADFTAVGYFFARDLHAKLGVPVGIIHSSWGGTPAEAWTSAAGLRDFPAFADTLARMESAATDPLGARRAYRADLDRWYREHDAGSGPADWSQPVLPSEGWENMALPTAWEDAGHPGFDGIVWFRKTFDLPATWQGGDVELHLGAIDDVDTTWVNGRLVGGLGQHQAPRIYRVPGASLQPRGNVIAVRVLDTGGNGGFWDLSQRLELVATDATFAPLPLAGEWLSRFSVRLDRLRRPPADISRSAGLPTVLFNGMIAPLVPYAIRGVAFYQGENNAERAREYRTLLPALIADWRRHWQTGDFPFLFVQIAPFKDQPPEIREAQLLAWQHTRNTAMVVTVDCGDAEDIHPTHKQPVGARLALAARALAYQEKLEYSGPVFNRLRVNGSRAEVRFTHLGGGLVATDGPLAGFTVAGADGVFHRAQAEIVRDTVVVSAPAVTQPVAVRYAWANVASGNLFNRAGLPASPFRSDVD